jgi:phosphatidylglycerophosphatase A
MKGPAEKRSAQGAADYTALALSTWGVGYLPLAPGTWGSLIAVGIYLVIGWFETNAATHGVATDKNLLQVTTFHWTLNAILLTAFCLIGTWASTRSIPLLGDHDASEIVVDELMGQFVTLAFIPFGLGWPFVLAGFLLFRLFDIVKPYPVDDLQQLPGGLGVCADDIIAGVYAGICLAVGYSIYLFV